MDHVIARSVRGIGPDSGLPTVTRVLTSETNSFGRLELDYSVVAGGADKDVDILTGHDCALPGPHRDRRGFLRPPAWVRAQSTNFCR